MTDNNNLGLIFFIIILVALSIWLLWFFIFRVKHLKTSDVYMIDGGVKTGKSEVTTMLAIKRVKRNQRKIAIFNFFRRIINKFRKVKKAPLDKPMLYSNMPLYKVKYNELTMEILLWKVSIPYKSVVLIDEATLLADSMTGMIPKSTDKEQAKVLRQKFDEVNEILTLFLKTFGHQTHGGACFYNSQNVSDLHFSFRRCTSTYLMITKRRKLPFFSLLDVREIVHDESGDVKNAVISDVDDDNKPLFVSNRWFKYYDHYYLDVLTKYLPKQVNYNVKKLDKKDKKDIKEILTLGNYERVKKYNERNLPKQVKENKEVKPNA